MRKPSILFLFILLNLVLISCSTAPKKEEQGVDQKTSPLQGKIVVRWQNVKGYDTYGFNIQRAESREGPFTKLNQDIVLASTTSKPDTDYMFVDQPLEIGKIYYYYVESVNYAGQKKQMTPLSKVVVKTPIDEPDPPPESR
jgi:hypothetical protein